MYDLSLDTPKNLLKKSLKHFTPQIGCILNFELSFVSAGENNRLLLMNLVWLIVIIKIIWRQVDLLVRQEF